MIDCTRVYFPLRSNVEWFQTEDMRRLIEERLKIAILICDEIVVEDGTYEAYITEEGSFAPYFPAGAVPVEERKIEFDRDLKPGFVRVGLQIQGRSEIHALNSGETVARYKVDYFELLRDIDIKEATFIKRVHIDKSKFPKEASRTISDATYRDKQALKDIHANQFLRNLFIDNLNYDIVTSILLESAVILDPRHASILLAKNRQADIVRGSLMPHAVAIRKLFSFPGIELGDMSVQDAIGLRADSLWVDFRSFVYSVVADLRNDPEVFMDPERVTDMVNKRVNKALFREMKKRYRSGKSLALDLAMGATSCIPGYGVIPTVVDAVSNIGDYLRDRSGWFAFLMNLPRA